MKTQRPFRILADDTLMPEVLRVLDTEKVEHSAARPFGDGSKPLNAPIDPEALNALLMTVTATAGSVAALLLALDKILNGAIRLKKKFSVLLSPDAPPVEIQSRADLEKLRDQLEEED